MVVFFSNFLSSSSNKNVPYYGKNSSIMGAESSISNLSINYNVKNNMMVGIVDTIFEVWPKISCLNGAETFTFHLFQILILHI